MHIVVFPLVTTYLLFVGGRVRQKCGDMEHHFSVLELRVHTVLTSGVS